MKSFLFALLPFSLYFIPVCMGQGHKCLTKNDQSGVISESSRNTILKCWTIQVPENMYVRLDITKLSLISAYKCSDVYLKITVTETNETYIYCSEDSSYRKPITALSDVTITFSNEEYPIRVVGYLVSSFSLKYHAENLICAQKNHFRCSNHKCIHDTKVCDGVRDCDNGSDEIGCEKGVLAVKGVNASRESTRSWLLKNRQSTGWGRNTHRAITALFLSQVASFQGQNLEEELMVKQLELQTSVALLSNSTDPLSVSELSMFVNGLSVACHDPRRFYGYDLVKILGERVSIAKSPSPGAYLTLCASNWTLTQSDLRSLFQLLHKHSTYPFTLEKGVLGVKGVKASRESTGDWLLSNQQSSGWGRNTHRAITALFLADVVSFREQNLEEELMVKQLELQTLLALIRNSTDTLSVNELSMFVNALTVACHDPRRFYGQDLVKILSERTSNAKSPSPGAYLALCSSKWTLMKSDIRSLLHLLHKHSPYPFVSDVQAVAVMALTCVKNSEGKEFSRIHNASNIYNSTIEKFINGQQSDGSFGNVYTTALITQALIASEQVNNTKWNMTSTVQYLMKQLNSSSVDFLSAYLALPVFSGKSLVDIAAANCANISRKQDEDIEFSDVANILGGKKRIQYSLYVGDQKDVIHTIYMGVTEQSTAYDIMRVAQVIDPKYKFHHRYVSDHIYVYEIAGIINDPEAGKFWLMHSENSNKTVEHFTESPDKFMVDNNGHLIMWYKTAHI